MVWFPCSFPRPGRCHCNPFPAGLRVLTQGTNCTGLLGPTSAAVFISSMADQSRYSFRICVARSQLSPVTDHWVRVLFYASSCLKGKRGCVLQACLCYPSQHHVVSKAVFRPSCKEQDKSNIKVYWPSTAALKLHPVETALPCCRGPNGGLGQKSWL